MSEIWWNVTQWWWNFWQNTPRKVRNRRRRWDAALAEVDLNQDDVDRLAIYNAEKARGIAHTAQCDRDMANRQDRYNRIRVSS